MLINLTVYPMQVAPAPVPTGIVVRTMQMDLETVIASGTKVDTVTACMDASLKRQTTDGGHDRRQICPVGVSQLFREYKVTESLLDVRADMEGLPVTGFHDLAGLAANPNTIGEQGALRQAVMIDGHRAYFTPRGPWGCTSYTSVGNGLITQYYTLTVMRINNQWGVMVFCEPRNERVVVICDQLNPALRLRDVVEFPLSRLNLSQVQSKVDHHVDMPDIPDGGGAYSRLRRVFDR